MDRKSKPKPQWTTDFIDNSKYKLSETEMIHKKASLQSKHREQGKKLLQQRRRKLEEGVIDEETKKIYETALTSKKININPPIRKNLSQMIREQRQKKVEASVEQPELEHSDDAEDQVYFGQDYQKELQQANRFIKKFQRAKKQQKIQRAVGILTEQTKSKVKGKKKENNKSTKQRKQKDQQDQTLYNIEETIKFMQQRLFGKKKQQGISSSRKPKQCIEEEQQSDAYRRNNTDNYQQKCTNNYKSKLCSENLREKGLNLYKEQSDSQQEQFQQRLHELSQLHMNMKQNDEMMDDECMNTIRRMREMIEETQQNCEENNINSYSNNQQYGIQNWQNQSFAHKQYPNSEDVQVDFSLTINDESNSRFKNQQSLAISSQPKFLRNQGNTKRNQTYEKKLFAKKKQQTLYDMEKSQTMNENRPNNEYIDEYQHIPDNKMLYQRQPTAVQYDKSPKKMKSALRSPRKKNMELQRIKNSVQNTKSSVQSIKVQQINLPVNNRNWVGYGININNNLK